MPGKVVRSSGPVAPYTQDVNIHLPHSDIYICVFHNRTQISSNSKAPRASIAVCNVRTSRRNFCCSSVCLYYRYPVHHGPVTCDPVPYSIRNLPQPNVPAFVRSNITISITAPPGMKTPNWTSFQRLWSVLACRLHSPPLHFLTLWRTDPSIGREDNCVNHSRCILFTVAGLCLRRRAYLVPSYVRMARTTQIPRL